MRSIHRLILPLFAMAVASSLASSPAKAADAAAAVLTPSKTWFSPGKPIEVKVAGQGDVTLVLTDFLGNPVQARGPADVAGGTGTVDVRTVFPAVDTAGTYLLYAVAKGADVAKGVTTFQGTPLVVGVRADRRSGAPNGPMVVKVEPLRYLVMTTNRGPITMAFYYDVAPHTTSNFLTLAAEGYFSGLSFHRIVPKFVIQGGDPRGDGTGGPGYQIDAEFNERPHHEGVLSMARSMDVNSAGSQFFVCLDYAQTKQLDRKYTAFGKVVGPMDAVKAIAAAPTNAENDRPNEPQTIEKVEVKDVAGTDNPYVQLQKDLQAK
jgi:peptidyl-prolyl cis-trans isomerase B (cyclophilin B)